MPFTNGVVINMPVCHLRGEWDDYRCWLKLDWLKLVKTGVTEYAFSHGRL